MIQAKLHKAANMELMILTDLVLIIWKTCNWRQMVRLLV